ncbi:peptide chain release factor 2 [Buchnera aphidicola]|uniref:Peptide chain release factor 2 n=1 Tax=Buchnera aphidicola (Anoecia oenotherae) TaxID=1241833 RepID=A0A4D6XQ05_9GAMM|nr:peptide chain release factor 2 [Buchnera aphidicola]QCI19452.1 peptide chain release factor 2 [Buchnera aphidicola (Anoecia oenotherae)]
MYSINFVKKLLNSIYKKKKIYVLYLKYCKKKERLAEINIELQSIKIWKEINILKKLLKEKSFLEEYLFPINRIQEKINYFKELLILVEQEKKKDEEVLGDIVKEIYNLKFKIKNLEFLKMFSKKYDFLNCYIDVQPGSGGEESQDWANMLLKMYLKWIYSKKFKINILEKTLGENNGIKSATIKVSGNYAFGWLRTEAGIHRLVRKNPFDTNNKRHTSFCSIFIYPEINKDFNTEINQNDLRIDVYKSSGAGGQHVNKTESAVRITHIPTGIVAQCQNDRSQHKNKEQAMKQLISKINHLSLKKEQLKKKKIEDSKPNITWGNHIRSYVLDDSRIKDIRTNIESRNIQKVLHGHLDKFIKASLKLGF